MAPSYYETALTLPPPLRRWWERPGVFWLYGIVKRRENAWLIARATAERGHFAVDLEPIAPKYFHRLPGSVWRQMRPGTVHIVRWRDHAGAVPLHLILQRREPDVPKDTPQQRAHARDARRDRRADGRRPRTRPHQ